MKAQRRPLLIISSLVVIALPIVAYARCRYMERRITEIEIGYEFQRFAAHAQEIRKNPSAVYLGTFRPTPFPPLQLPEMPWYCRKW